MALFQKRQQTAELAVYMSDVEFSQVLAVFEAVGPRVCLEWGSGGSTRALLEQCPFIEKYVSVEHDQRWFENVRSQIRDPRLDLHCAPADDPLPTGSNRQEEIAWCARAEANPAMFATYVGLPRTLHPSYDLVMVDGRARNFCLREGYSLLRQGGVLLLHDAQREDYRAAVTALGRPRFLEPWNQGQVCIVRKS